LSAKKTPVETAADKAAGALNTPSEDKMKEKLFSVNPNKKPLEYIYRPGGIEL